MGVVCPVVGVWRGGDGEGGSAVDPLDLGSDICTLGEVREVVR